ncbi:MAG TPA: hypothetical protein VFW34_10670 [Candidatus Rubrimentiphilum sp.]|nr:hypothetical protein [Candidatus Rubrimentiphilum sp.]
MSVMPVRAREQTAFRTVARTFVLAIIALWALGWVLYAAFVPTAVGAIFGWNMGPDGSTIIYVTPGGPAANGGVRVGDRIDWKTLPLEGRANLAIPMAEKAGTVMPITITRGSKTIHTTLAARLWGSFYRLVQIANYALGAVVIAIGIALVRLRPTRMTWAFVLTFVSYGLGIGTTPFLAQTSVSDFVLQNGAYALLTGLSVAGLLIFVSRFPTDRAHGIFASVDRSAPLIGALVAALTLTINAILLFSSAPPPMWLLFSYQYLASAVIGVVSLAVLGAAHFMSRGSDRHRIAPVLFWLSFYVVATLANNIYNFLYTSEIGIALFTGLMDFALLMIAIAVAYGIVRYRVVDISFVISRTLVYTLLTSLIVGVFVLIDFLSSKVLDRLQIAVVIEAVAALAFGIWLNALHSRIDRLIDTVLFRRRHLAERRLHRAGRTLMHAESPTFIDEVLTVEACDALALASAAVFRKEGDEIFERTAAIGWNDDHTLRLTRDDHLVVNLLAELEAMDVTAVRWPHAKVPHGYAQPLLALPFVVRHELLGFALYGGHIGGEAIDADERHTLAHLSSAAAAAYEHVHSKTLLNEANELRAKVSLLTHERRLLREVVDTLGNPARSVQQEEV